MEHQKITNVLGTTPNEVPRFITKKRIEVHDQSGNSQDRYKPGKQIRFKTSMLRSDLCDFSDAYIVAKGTITVTKKTFTANDFDLPNNTAANATATNTANDNAFGEKKFVFKNNAPFINFISKINGVKIDAMPMYNLLEYSKNYRKTTGSLWNYYRDEPNNPPLNDDDPPTINYNADPITNSESFKYKSSITGKTSNANQGTEQGNTKTKKILKLLFH